MRALIFTLQVSLCVSVQEERMKKIEYYQHEPHYDPEKVTGDLVSFVYDVPYLAACGIFPPLHILNQVLSEGGGDAGMSPGASWKPFKLSDDEYNQLWALIEKTDPTSLKSRARFAAVKYKRDIELENIMDHMEWMSKACDKHREWFFNEQNKSNDV